MVRVGRRRHKLREGSGLSGGPGSCRNPEMTAGQPCRFRTSPDRAKRDFPWKDREYFTEELQAEESAV